MSKIVQQATDQLRTLIVEAIGRAVAAGDLPSEPIPDFTVEVPADRSHGDWASNAAMVSARAFHMAPRKIAQAIADNLSLDGTFFEKFEIAGPGFLNFFLGRSFYSEILHDVRPVSYTHLDVYKRQPQHGTGNPVNLMQKGNPKIKPGRPHSFGHFYAAQKRIGFIRQGKNEIELSPAHPLEFFEHGKPVKNMADIHQQRQERNRKQTDPRRKEIDGDKLQGACLLYTSISVTVSVGTRISWIKS